MLARKYRRGKTPLAKGGQELQKETKKDLGYV